MTIAELDEVKILTAVRKQEVDCTDEDRKFRQLERYGCRQSFVRFLKHCFIIEAPTLDNPGGVIKFELWEHIKHAISILLTEKLIVWLKSRQIGASWLIAAYVLWYAVFHQGATVMLFSKGEIEAMELLAKCKRIYDNLPDFLRIKMQPSSGTEIGFPVMMSSIKALAATETAGISFTSSIVVCDEWEEHPYADQNFLSSKPTRDAGGQFIGIFTVNKQKPETLAKAVFRDATDGKNDFVPLFTAWHERPGRDAEWYEITKRNIPSRELATLTPDLYMEQNYPGSIDEAFRATQTVSAFNLKVLDEMMGNTSNIRIIKDGIDSSIVNIFKDHNIGNYYIVGTDTSHGVGKDFSVTVLMNVKTGEIIADIFNKTLTPEELAYHSLKLLDVFQSPLWYIESNDWGRVTVSMAQDLGYKNLGYQDDKKTKLGFQTNEATRRDLWGGLIPAINNRQVVIYNKAGLQQFYDVIRNIDKEGRIEAMAGRHDDYPIAAGICWLKKDEVNTGISNLKPLETLHFRSKHITRR